MRGSSYFWKMSIFEPNESKLPMLTARELEMGTRVVLVHPEPQ